MIAKKAKSGRSKRQTAEAVLMARQVKKRLAALGITEDAEAPPGVDGQQWLRLRRRLIDEVVHDVADEWRQRRLGQVVPDFTPLTPDEVAEPVDLPVWRVRGLWALGSHGTWAGPKKSLKTTLHDCMAIAVASGQRVLGEWNVPEPGPVLIYAGEGSVEWRKKSIQRIAHDLYNVKIGSGDDQAHVFVVPAAYPFNTSDFRLALTRNINAIRPAFVTLDSTYNYHPRGINTADMYDRGPLFAELSALVREADPETSLLLIDHMRQAASLDLDAIAMAGVGQWVDSWILNVPVSDECNPEEGTFKVNVEIGSRRWGARRKVIDLDLGRFDEATDQWTRPITADVAASEWSARRAGRSDDKLDATILQYVKDQPWTLTYSALVEKVGGNAPRTRERVDALASQRVIAFERREAEEGKRKVARERAGIPDEPHVEPATPSGASAAKTPDRRRATTSRRKGRG